MAGMELHSGESGARPLGPGQEHIVVQHGYCGGKPHVAGTRIKVQHIAIWHERMGMSPEEIGATYPGLTLAVVYAALAYYHGHRSEIDADIEADERFVAAHKAKAGPSHVQQRLAALRDKNDPLPPG
jgi:uncharacterized protein (DUF433 family)